MKSIEVLASPELLSLCQEVKEAVGALLRDVSEPFDGYGRYESDVEARVLFLSLARHIEGLLECARINFALLPAGGTLTRAAFEQGIKIQWLLHPANVFDREARFLAHLSEDERTWKRCGRYSKVEKFEAASVLISQFRMEVEQALPPGTLLLKGIPKLSEMLKELGEEQRYTAYILLSQQVHGSHLGGSVYRRGLGKDKDFGEQISVQDWVSLVEIVWWSIFYAAQKIENTCARRDIRSLDNRSIARINDQINKLRRVIETRQSNPAAPADQKAPPPGR